MKYYITTGHNGDTSLIIDMFIYPEDNFTVNTFEVDKDLFYELFEIRKTREVIINVTDSKDLIECIKTKDFSFEEFDSLKKLKTDLLNQFNMSIVKHISPTIFIDSYNFVINNNKLISHGFTITEENREEKYLEILQMENNEELIDLLEKYLISMDLLSSYNYNLQFYHQLVDEVNMAETKEELVDIRDRYYKKICQ